MTQTRNSHHLKILLAILLVAGCLRLWGAFDITGYTGDESFHVPSAISMGQHGTPLSSNWTHPPGGALILLGTITLFGDNPVGWRLGGIALGTATVGLLYLVAARLFRNETAALLAAALLALDPFHIHFSRTTFMEIPVLCFFLLFVHCMLTYQDTGSKWSLVVAGFALGLAVATKSYFVCSMTLVIGFAMYLAMKGEGDRTALALDFLCWLGCLPAAVYLLANYHFFARGFSLAEFFQMRGDALWTLRNITLESFENRWFLDVGGKPWEWFVKPIVFGVRLGNDAAGSRYLLDSNLDWGQGVKQLAEYLRTRGNPPVIFAYFGVARPEAYGVSYAPLGLVSNAELRGTGAQVCGMKETLLAVSATNLQGTYYPDKKTFDWLKARTPAYTAGYSIFVYDLTRDADGLRRLGELFDREGRNPEADCLYARAGN